jgi:predicted dehydrogenase
MINIGIIGVGYWGPNYARLCFEMGDVNLSWCADLDENALKKIQQRYPSVKTTKNYKEILNDPKLDAVVIVTPAQTHFTIAKDALLANKHVLLEKPITSKLSEAKELGKVVSKSKKILMVDHIFKFNPTVTKLKELINNDELGNIYYIAASYTALGPIRKDVDAMWDLAPHWIYVINHLLNEKPVTIQANGKDYLKEKMNDVVFLHLEYPRKVLVNIHVSWLFPQKVRNIAIVGDKKMAVMDDVSSDTKLALFDKGAKYNSNDPNFANLQVIFREGDIVIPKLEKKEPLKEVLKHFCECITNDKNPFTGVKEGIDVIEILEAADRSLQKKGEVVTL